jgi:hypothetical protein
VHGVFVEVYLLVGASLKETGTDEQGAGQGGLQSLLEFFGEGRNLLPLQRFKPQTVQPVSLVSIPTALSGLLSVKNLHIKFQSIWKICLLT